MFNPNFSLFPEALGFSGLNCIPALSGAFNVIVPWVSLIISFLVLLVELSKLLNPNATWFFIVLAPVPPPFPFIVPAFITFILATLSIELKLGFKELDEYPVCVPWTSIPAFFELFKFIVPIYLKGSLIVPSTPSSIINALVSWAFTSTFVFTLFKFEIVPHVEIKPFCALTVTVLSFKL